MSVDATLGEGDYLLAEGVAEFDQSIAVLDHQTGAELGTLTVDQKTSVGNFDYTLNLSEGSLFVTVAAGCPKARRIPASNEPLAFCARCGEWTPMRWRPKEERGHAAETWFECEYCGCRELRLRCLAVKTAVPTPSINQTLK